MSNICDIQGPEERNVKHISHCPNCGRSDGWHVAQGHPPLPVGDCRKIVWMRDKDGMEWWGVRAYNFAEMGWYANGREESSSVLFWMETPHNPNYPSPEPAPAQPHHKEREEQGDGPRMS